jgi:transcriptional regulator with XRE-family HTH domain
VTQINSSDLGKMLKQQRIMSRLTLRELSAATGVSTSHLGRIERGDRFPSAGILRKIVKPLGFEVEELLIRACYLSPKSYPTESETGAGAAEVDPYVARVLAQEPVEVQGAVLGIFSILKFVGKAARSAELPEFREYIQQKYPYLDEDLITMIEDLIARKAN